MLDWKKYISIADRFQYKVNSQDRDDLRHDIVLALARAERKHNSGHTLTQLAMLRIAQYECQKYYRQLKRRHRELSLNIMLNDGDGDGTELGDTLLDNKAIDLDARLDARNWLLNCPRRLVSIGVKILSGRPLTNSEHQYLYRFRRNRSFIY